MKKTKTPPAPKNTIVNISSAQFEQMAIEAANINGMNEIEHISTSFNRFASIDQNSTNVTATNFSAIYTIQGFHYIGNAKHPQLAIELAIDDYKQKNGLTIINPQTKIEHENTIEQLSSEGATS